MAAIRSSAAERGWETVVVKTIGEALTLLGDSTFDAVLARETLSDGRGYDLRDTVLGSGGTLLVGVTLSDGWVWLPVVARGQYIFGKRTLGEDSFEPQLEQILRSSGQGDVREITTGARPGPAHLGLHHAMSPRAKSRRRSPSH